MDGMLELWQEFHTWLADYPRLELWFGVLVLLLVAALSNFVVKQLLIRALVSAIRSLPLEEDKRVMKSSIIARLANVLPALVFYFGAPMVPHLPEVAVTIIHNVTNAFIILTVAMSIGGALTLMNMVYERRHDGIRKPIKGYIQVVKIAVYVVAAILIIATLIDRSPLILLSGIGAMAAVVILVFQDTLLSLVASMQISSSDIIRVGDWVEMPHLNVDGEVIDIALHLVKVQNWDRTISSIPTVDLLRMRSKIGEECRSWVGVELCATYY